MSSAFSTQVSSYGAPLSPMFDLQYDYPSPALPYAPSSPAEQLASHPNTCAAATKIIAAAGQITSILQKPFLFICDATMGVSFNVVPLSFYLSMKSSLHLLANNAALPHSDTHFLFSV